MIKRIEAMIKEKTAKKKVVRTSWDDDDKKLIIEVYHGLNT
jgi:hypothetical protein